MGNRKQHDLFAGPEKEKTSFNPSIGVCSKKKIEGGVKEAKTKRSFLKNNLNDP